MPSWFDGADRLAGGYTLIAQALTYFPHILISHFYAGTPTCMRPVATGVGRHFDVGTLQNNSSVMLVNCTPAANSAYAVLNEAGAEKLQPFQNRGALFHYFLSPYGLMICILGVRLAYRWATRRIDDLTKQPDDICAKSFVRKLLVFKLIALIYATLLLVLEDRIMGGASSGSWVIEWLVTSLQIGSLATGNALIPTVFNCGITLESDKAVFATTICTTDKALLVEKLHLGLCFWLLYVILRLNCNFYYWSSFVSNPNKHLAFMRECLTVFHGVYPVPAGDYRDYSNRRVPNDVELILFMCGMGLNKVVLMHWMWHTRGMPRAVISEAVWKDYDSWRAQQGEGINAAAGNNAPEAQGNFRAENEGRPRRRANHMNEH